MTKKLDTAPREPGDQLSKLLDMLLGLGFSWNDIARVAGVPTAYARKWRSEAQVTGETFEKVETFVSFCQHAQNKHLIVDVVSWMETPLHTDAPLTVLDFIVEGRYDLAVQHADTHGTDPEQILDLFDAGWRERYMSAVDVFTAPDGLPGIRFAVRPAVNAETG